MKKYGSLIAKLRKKNNLTQAQLGEKLNISYQAVSKWENDLSEPDLVTIEKLADIFNITVSEFFDMANNPDKIYNTNSNITNNTISNTKPKFEFTKFVKLKPWYLVAGLGCIVLLLSLIVALVPIKYSSSQIYKMVDPSVFCIKAEYSNTIQTGTGFFINDKGLAVTNYHVIKKCTSGKVQLNNGKIYNIKKVVGYDEDLDIAIIQIDIKKSKPVRLGNSNKVKVGETVYAIGYPQAYALGSMDSTLTQGIVSKKAYTIEGNTYIQTTADITNGNSGGVLVNNRGEVIGITSGQITINGVATNYMNLAIPINKIKSVKRDFNGTLAQLAEKHGNHTVTFMSDGEVYATSSIAYNAKVSAKTITKTGYQFEGWYIDSNRTIPFDFNQGIKVNTTLYAKWKANTYIVRFNSNGGNGFMSNMICEYGKEYTLPDNTFTYAHYNFKYWLMTTTSVVYYPNTTKFKNLTTTNNGVVEVKAYWQAVKYTITYTSSNELVPLGNREMKYYYTYYEEFDLPNITCNNNVYKFIGWTGEGITKPTLNVVIPKYSYGEKYFVAHWELQTYKITYEYLGSLSNAINNGTYINEYTYETPTFTLPIPTREHYTFVGWKLNTQTIITQVKQFSYGLLHLEAVWERGDYTISYSTNNEYVQPIFESEKAFYKSEDDDFNLPNVSEKHFEFIGWTSADILTPKLTVTIPSGSIGDLHFVSNWKPITYTITYNMEGIETDERYITEYTYAMEPYELPIPFKEDTGFFGWINQDNDIMWSVPTANYENLILRPNWNSEKFRITYKDKNNKVLKSEEIIREKFPYNITYYNPSGCYYFDNNMYSDVECTKLIINGEDKTTYSLTTPMDFNVYINAYYTKDDFTYYSWEGGNKIADKYIGTDKNVYVPNNITKLYGSTFFFNTNIENVYISDSVTVMGYQIFMGSSVKYVKLSNNLKSMGEKCFYECTNLESVVLPDSLEEIGYHAFYNCTALKEIDIPDKVTALDQTFYNCTNLKRVTLPTNLKIFGYEGRLGVFEYCSSLEEVVIPEKVEQMTYRSFYGCTSLKTVIMKSNLITTIRNYNFKNCTNLTTLVLGSGIQIIGEEVFEGCDSLEIFIIMEHRNNLRLLNLNVL